jgi:hypothetical protein
MLVLLSILVILFLPKGEASKKCCFCHPLYFSGIMAHFKDIFLVLRKRSIKSLVSFDTNAYMLAPPLPVTKLTRRQCCAKFVCIQELSISWDAEPPAFLDHILGANCVHVPII